LKEDPEASLPTNGTVVADEEKDATPTARRRKSDAVYTMTMALEKEATKFIYSGMTEQWQSGKAQLIVQALLHPRDATSQLDSSQALMRL
jgi:hypothetical protein